jgi:hypothetical protein
MNNIIPFNNRRFGSPVGSPFMTESTLSDGSTYGGYGGYNNGYNGGIYGDSLYGDSLYGDSMYGAGHGYFGRSGRYHHRTPYLGGSIYDDRFDDGLYLPRHHYMEPYISSGYSHVIPYRRRRGGYYYRGRRDPLCMMM